MMGILHGDSPVHVLPLPPLQPPVGTPGGRGTRKMPQVRISLLEQGQRRTQAGETFQEEVQARMKAIAVLMESTALKERLADSIESTSENGASPIPNEDSDSSMARMPQQPRMGGLFGIRALADC
jgi:hypothetical protein